MRGELKTGIKTYTEFMGCRGEKNIGDNNWNRLYNIPFKIEIFQTYAFPCIRKLD